MVRSHCLMLSFRDRVIFFLIIWTKGALGLDGNTYFMPNDALRILKIDLRNDTVCSIGDDLGIKWKKYKGAVLGIDGCVYGIPYHSTRIIKYDPETEITSYVGEESNGDFYGNGNGSLARDGYIYAAKQGNNGEVLKVDTTNNTYSTVGNLIESNHDSSAWGDAIMEIDGCIYWLPFFCGNRTLKYDPYRPLFSCRK